MEALRQPPRPVGRPAKPYTLGRFGTTAAEVRRIRESLGLTQQQFADLFHYAVRQIIRWETGKSEPHYCVLLYLRAVDRAMGRGSKPRPMPDYDQRVIADATSDPRAHKMKRGRKPGKPNRPREFPEM